MELIIFVHSAQEGRVFAAERRLHLRAKSHSSKKKTRCLRLLRFCAAGCDAPGPRPFLWPEPVARAPYGLDMARRGRVFFDLLAQAVDVNGHRGVIAQGIAAQMRSYKVSRLKTMSALDIKNSSSSYSLFFSSTSFPSTKTRRESLRRLDAPPKQNARR